MPYSGTIPVSAEYQLILCYLSLVPIVPVQVCTSNSTVIRLFFSVTGTHKATPKFRILQQQVARALHNRPQPGPFTFVAECMYIIPLMGPTYAEGFSHMLLSSLRHFKPQESTRADFSNSKRVAACLLFDILSGNVVHEERIIRKIMEAYELGTLYHFCTSAVNVTHLCTSTVNKS